jgi:methyl acetate hydrolase
LSCHHEIAIERQRDDTQVRDGTGGGRSHHVQNAKLPLTSDLGTGWDYGINIDFICKAVEAVSGKRAPAAEPGRV